MVGYVPRSGTYKRVSGKHKNEIPMIQITTYNKYLSLILFFMTTIISNAQTLKTVPNVDLNKYAGKWYEIASYPQRFQKGCHCTTAQYTLSEKGYVIVENRCNKDSITGKQSYIKGKAFVEKNSGNAMLKVQFFWPFKGKYWIIDLANDYSFAVVSHPNRKYLWILSRTPKLDNTIYQQILSRLKEKGFDLTKLQSTIQSGK
ncbi:MAG: lipocalin family protein [Bacteroidia bacterium]